MPVRSRVRARMPCASSPALSRPCPLSDVSSSLASPSGPRAPCVCVCARSLSLAVAATGTALAGGGPRGTRQKRKAAITVHELPKSAEEPSLLAMERETKKGSHGLENSAGARAPSRREKAKVGVCVGGWVGEGGGGEGARLYFACGRTHALTHHHAHPPIHPTTHARTHIDPDQLEHPSETKFARRAWHYC